MICLVERWQRVDSVDSWEPIGAYNVVYDGDRGELLLRHIAIERCNYIASVFNVNIGHEYISFDGTIKVSEHTYELFKVRCSFSPDIRC